MGYLIARDCGACLCCLSEEDVAALVTQTNIPTEVSLLVPTDLPGHKHPLRVYITGLDKASRPTMESAARLVVRSLAPGMDVDRFPWHQITYAVTKRLRALLRENGAAPRTINKALTLVRSVLQESWRLGLITHEEYARAADVENLVSHKLPAGRFVEPEEVDRLLAACTSDMQSAGRRDATLVALLRGAGLREKEAVTLSRGDYNPKTGTIRVQGKGHKERAAYMERDFEGHVLRLLDEVPGDPEEPLVHGLSPRGTVRKPLRAVSTQAVHIALAGRAAQAGVAPLTPHDLRRTFITMQLERGVDPLRLARAVGHASPKTTMIYDRRTGESDRRSIRGED